MWVSPGSKVTSFRLYLVSSALDFVENEQKGCSFKQFFFSILQKNGFLFRDLWVLVRLDTVFVSLFG